MMLPFKSEEAVQEEPDSHVTVTDDVTAVRVPWSDSAGWHRLTRFGVYLCALAQEVRSRYDPPEQASSGVALPQEVLVSMALSG